MSVYAKVNIEIIRATSLLGMNIGGLSNPFVKVEIGAKNYTTPTIDNTTEPNWRAQGHQAQCTFKFPAVHVPTVVTISVYNKLPYGDQLSDFIGQASVTVMRPGQNQQMIPLTHGGNMQLANRAPTGCGMIEVSYDAREVSEGEYFDALLGKTSNAAANAPVIATNTNININNNNNVVGVPIVVEQQQQQQTQQQQQQQQFVPLAASTSNVNSTTGGPSLSSTANSTPMEATLNPTSSASNMINNNNNNNNVQQNETQQQQQPQQQQQQNQEPPTPDVSMVQPQQQTTLSQQHQIPSIGSFSNSMNNNSNLPPKAPQSMNLAHSNSGAMPSFESSQNNQNQQQQQGIQVQAPSQSNAYPTPEPQAHYAYVPQAVASTGVNNNSGRVVNNNNNAAVAGGFSTNNNNNNHLPPSGRRSSSAGRKDPCSSTMTSGRNNNNQSGIMMNKSAAIMNHSLATSNILNNNNNNNTSISNNNNNKPKSEKLSVSATRWFDLIRSGNPASSGSALREIRAASEKDPSIILEACDASGRTLIHEAAWSGSVELFQELLALAIRASNARPTAMSMQLWASEQHNVAAWTTIPQDGYQGPRYVTSNAGNTVLHTAATAGRTDLVDWMLRQGAVFVAMAQTRNKRGLRPLESAAERGHMDTAQVLARSTTA